MSPTRVLYRLDQWAATLAGVALLCMMLVGAANVLSTKLLNAPIAGTYELTETLMIASAFLAMALAQADNSHIRVELLVNRLKGRSRVFIDALAQLGTGAFFAGIAWFGWNSAIHSINAGEFSPGSLPIPIWPARVALAFGATLVTVQSAVYLVLHARALVTDRSDTIRRNQ